MTIKTMRTVFCSIALLLALASPIFAQPARRGVEPDESDRPKIDVEAWIGDRWVPLNPIRA